MSGEKPRVINAIFHVYTNEKIIPIIKPNAASRIREICSVVSPYKDPISSVRILPRIPGALSFESNHEIYLYNIDVKRSFLNLKIRFSPINENMYFCRKVTIPITIASSKNIPQ